MLSHTRMGVPYEYTHMGRPIRVWANIRIWGRTIPPYDAISAPRYSTEWKLWNACYVKYKYLT